MAGRLGGDMGTGGVAAGLCACLLGIGLARFAYGPLLPAMVGAGWFDAAQADYLGAANLAGYLAGALAARLLPLRPTPALLTALMAVAAASLLACALPAFGWFLGWRLASGAAGAMLMILAPPAVLAHVAPARRGLASGVIFTGVGLGIAASGVAVPILLRGGVARTWIALGIAGLGLTLLAARGWPAPDGTVPPAPARPDGDEDGAGGAAGAALRRLYVQYALNAVGLVPHMLYLADYVARGLRHGVAAGATAWTLFGAGALAGPVLAGALADRLGPARALRLAYVVQAAAIAVPALTGRMPAVLCSAVIVGAAVPGVVPLVLARVRHLAHTAAAQRRAWAAATIAFALGQAASGYGLSALLVRTDSFTLLFAVGAGAILAALAIDLLAGGARRRARISPSSPAAGRA